MVSETLAGRTALVTGGASGIGAACVRALSDAGASVTIADLNEGAAQELADEVGGTTWIVDLAQTASLANMRLDVDILVNNAGLQRTSPIDMFDPDDFRLIVALMLEAPFMLIRAALPAMYARNFGRIINMSSVHGLRASETKVGYVAAKHGLEGLSKVTALEGGRHGVTSNCINPGYARTALVQRQVEDQARDRGITEDEVLQDVLLGLNAIKRLVEPREIASLVCWLASDDAAMVTGASYTMDGGWSAR
ncbi:MAG TPA: 3-hydroxybutyrate dehydrogenase [Acidothermaceae bacterium]